MTKAKPPERVVSRERHDEIRSIADGLTREYLKAIKQPFDLDLRIRIGDMHQEVLYPEFEFSLIEDVDLGFRGYDKILGKTVVGDRTVLIDPTLVGDARYAFTAGHEFGHAVLHAGQGELFRCAESDLSDHGRDPLEVEANLFAEHLLMPADIVRRLFELCHKPTRPIRYIGPGTYSFSLAGAGSQTRIGSYTHFCRQYASPLRFSFGNVSVTALALKLHKLSLIQNTTEEEFNPNEAYSVARDPDPCLVLRRAFAHL